MRRLRWCREKVELKESEMVMARVCISEVLAVDIQHRKLWIV